MCALNSNEVKDGLDERAVGRLRSMVTSVVDMGRRIYDAPPSVDPVI